MYFGSSVQEFMLFTSQVLVERTNPGDRKTVKEQGAYIYCIMSDMAVSL